MEAQGILVKTTSGKKKIIVKLHNLKDFISISRVFMLFFFCKVALFDGWGHWYHWACVHHH